MLLGIMGSRFEMEPVNVAEVVSKKSEEKVINRK